MASNVLVGVAAIPEPLLRAQSVAGKFFLMFFAIAVFAVVFGLVLLFFASLFKGKTGERVQGVLRRSRSRPPRGGPDVPRDPHHHPVTARALRRR